jgi:hypothetical protein
MSKLSRKEMEIRYRLFQKANLQDYRNYATRVVSRTSKAEGQLVSLKALFALLAGLAAALAGFVVQNWYLNGGACVTEPIADYCGNLQILVGLLTIATIVFPAIAALFNTLIELYQFDDLVPVYEMTTENLEIVDSLAPLQEMDDSVYEASLRTYGESTLRVMREETRRFEQAARIKPEQLERFVASQRAKAARIQFMGQPIEGNEDSS